MVAHALQQSTHGVPASWALSRRLFDLAPAGVCHATHVTVSAVGSYPTFSPLPTTCCRRSVFCGTVRRADYARPGVTWQPCPMEPGLSSSGCSPRATVRPAAPRNITKLSLADHAVPGGIVFTEQLHPCGRPLLPRVQNPLHRRTIRLHSTDRRSLEARPRVRSPDR